MCGKAAVSHLSWVDVYAYAASLTPPVALPADPESRINISPSRLRCKSEPESMVRESLPVIRRREHEDSPAEAIWPFTPVYSEGHFPTNKEGRLISMANAHLRDESRPFAPTFMGAWSAQFLVLVIIFWFYEFDSRVKPQIPYAVFPTDAPFWMMAGLAQRTMLPDGSPHLSVAVITVSPNEILKSVRHHRSPALLRDPDEAALWLHGSKRDALGLLRPHGNETMGVEAVRMGIKIPGNKGMRLSEVMFNSSSLFLILRAMPFPRKLVSGLGGMRVR